MSTTGTYTYYGAAGITASNSGTNLTIDVLGVTSANGQGIVANNQGSGDLSITAAGNVTGGASPEAALMQRIRLMATT